ncbi:hypothetical protein Sango_2713900 [Sesamum angolense]|uniref:SWIM-type domain-containing protein n=1 Tax=Sesamum angolense TaxID=2727404 RepID=A0AAE1W3F7_9LAMI|nr:hypothetical protein Sango_2713900 [Sesamum angolense]
MTQELAFRHMLGNLNLKWDMHGGQNVVDINMETCSCRRWELTGIPCVHAVSAIVSCGRIPKDYVHNSYSIETFRKTYNFIINPLRGQTEWPETGGTSSTKL